MSNLEVLSAACSLFQIIGFLLIISWNNFEWPTRPIAGVLIAVSGLAAVVNVFLPLAGHHSALYVVAAICGVAIIGVGCRILAAL